MNLLFAFQPLAAFAESQRPINSDSNQEILCVSICAVVASTFLLLLRSAAPFNVDRVSGQQSHPAS
jgi:hypothetical protein